jgi:hypothetical protein
VKDKVSLRRAEPLGAGTSVQQAAVRRHKVSLLRVRRIVSWKGLACD